MELSPSAVALTFNPLTLKYLPAFKLVVHNYPFKNCRDPSSRPSITMLFFRGYVISVGCMLFLVMASCTAESSQKIEK